MRLINLPLRLSNVVEKVERGELRFKIELTEIDERIADLKSMFLFTSCTICSIFCIGGALIVYSLGLGKTALFLSLMGFSSFIYGNAKRKSRKKDFIRNQLLGVPDKS